MEIEATKKQIFLILWRKTYRGVFTFFLSPILILREMTMSREALHDLDGAGNKTLWIGYKFKAIKLVSFVFFSVFTYCCYLYLSEATIMLKSIHAALEYKNATDQTAVKCMEELFKLYKTGTPVNSALPLGFVALIGGYVVAAYFTYTYDKAVKAKTEAGK